jgi:hypothetical protein
MWLMWEVVRGVCRWEGLLMCDRREIDDEVMIEHEFVGMRARMS